MRVSLALLCLSPSLLALEFDEGKTLSPYPDTVDQIVSGDLDGDGDLDLVTRDDYVGNVTIYRNDGRGRFERTAVMEPATGQGVSKIADMDGDGIPDLVLSDLGVSEEGEFNARVRIRFGSGLGGFGPREKDLGLFEPYPGFQLEDIDHSGLPDLMSPGTTLMDPGKEGPLQVIQSTPGEHFTSLAKENLKWLDWSGDGLPDVYDSRYGVWWENSGGGRFSEAQQIPSGGETPYSGFIPVRDSRLEGGRGVIIPRGEGESLSIVRLSLVLPDEYGDWVEQSSTPVPEGWEIIDVFPGEGGRTLASARRYQGMTNQWYGDFEYEIVELSLRFRRSVPSVAIIPLVKGLSCQVNALTLADMSGDGRDDLVVGSGYSGGTVEAAFALGGAQLSYFKGRPGGGFARKAVELTPPSSRETVRAVLDFDGDGDDDLICAGHATAGHDAQISFWENKDHGSRFDRHVLLSAPNSIEFTSAADRNGDGRPDILAYSNAYLTEAFVEQQVSLSLSNRATGRRLVKTLWKEQRDGELVHAEAGDWDGDGVEDLMLSHFDFPSKSDPEIQFPVSYLKGLRGNRFAAPSSLGGDGFKTLYDADGDGDPDLVPWESRLGDAGATSWLENVGAGVPPVVRTFPGVNGAAASVFPAGADIDQDGRMDFKSLVTPLLSKGGGNLLPLSPLPGDKVWFLDMDGDGDTDILIRTEDPEYFFSSGLLWMENSGAGLFSAARVLQAASPSRWDEALIGDLDGDGKMDVIASAIEARARIEWFRGK